MKRITKQGIVDVAAKKYITIGELAEQLGVSVEVLRKWERDFPGVIHPKRTRGETRLYDARQRERVAMVHRLLRQEGMTIQGVRQRLGSRGDEEADKQAVIARLYEVRADLMAMVEELDNISSQATPFELHLYDEHDQSADPPTSDR